MKKNVDKQRVAKNIYTPTASSPSAGTPLVGGDPNSVVFLDAGGDMRAIQGRISYDETTGDFNVQDNLGNFFLGINPSLGFYQLGDLSSIGNSSMLFLDDANNLIRLSASNYMAVELDAGIGYAGIGVAQGFGNETRVEVNDQQNSVTLTSAGDTAKILLQGGVAHRINTHAYGASYFANFYDYHIYFSTGTGATTLVLDTDPNIEIGQTYVISDLDRISATSNITIDAGVGNTIVTSVSAAQTFVMATNGLSVTIQKVTSTQWMLIARNT